VRHSLSETIAHLYRDAKGTVHAIVLGPRLESVITNALQNQREASPSLGLSPAMIESVQRGMTENLETSMALGHQPVVLCPATVRPYFYRLIHTSFPNVSVLSFTELPAETEIEFIGKLEIEHAN
ncbi:MAG: flagellar biosynthesis protein FlhA, partial [Bacteroidetes bacterium]|nr:flagellar biosynthesis protein FlhA [Bacteroidota bacterium]